MWTDGRSSPLWLPAWSPHRAPSWRSRACPGTWSAYVMIMIGARRIRFWPVIGARCGGPTSTERVGSPASPGPTRVPTPGRPYSARYRATADGRGCTRSVPPLTPRTARRPHRGSRCRTAGLRAHSGIAENQEQRGIFTKDTAKTARRPADQIQPPGLQRSRPRNLCHTSLIVENAVAPASFHDHRPASAPSRPRTSTYGRR